MIYAIAMKIMGSVEDGWSSIMVALTFIGAIQLLSLGIVAEYIAKIYEEVKERPVYIIMDKYTNTNK
jgi:polyisoprenyl-phosphate glycosyltransferase